MTRLAETVAEIEFLKAVQSGDLGKVEEFLKDGIDPNCHDSVGFSPLIFSSIFDFSDIATVLLEYGANKQATDSTSWTALDHAKFNNSQNVQSVLLDRRRIKVRSNSQIAISQPS